MKRKAKLSGSDPKPVPWKFDGFNRGVDTYSLDTEVHPNALSDAENMELIGRASIRPRRGSLNLGSPIGGGTVDGLFVYDNNVVSELLGLSGGTLKKLNAATGAWSAITGGSFTAGKLTRATQLQNNLYFGNGVDDFKKYNGTQVSTFTTQNSPTGLAVSPQGTTGTTKWAYQITTVTANGESLPTSIVEISNGNSTLDTTNYNRVTWNRLTDASVVGYNVYGRAINSGRGITLITFVPNPASGATVTWDDKGTITPQSWLPPEGDSTGGEKLTVLGSMRGSLVGLKEGTDRFYWSGTGAKYESFSPSQNGGFVDIRRGDGDGGLMGCEQHEKNYYIFKRHSIHRFYFNADGDGVLEEVILGVGCGAAGSVAFVENDLLYLDSDLKLRVLGYEPNYYGTVRTSTLSDGRVESYFDEIDPAYASNITATYYKGRYLLAATRKGSTTNDVVIPYNRKYMAFEGRWTGWNVRCWVIWSGKLYAGASNSSQVFQVLVGRNDNSKGVAARLVTRNEDLSNSSQSKFWEWADFRFYSIRGTLKIKTIVDGSMTVDTRTIDSRTYSGVGGARPGLFMPGEATGVGTTFQQTDVPYRKTIEQSARTLKFEVSKDGFDDDFILISIRGRAIPEPEEVFDNNNMI